MNVVKQIANLKPGEQITFDFHFLRNQFYFDPIDTIMNRIVGSAYTIAIKVDDFKRQVTFYRLNYDLEDDLRTYVSPDRRDLFIQDGYFWKLKTSS